MIEAQEEKSPGLQKICEKYSGEVAFETALLGAQTGEEVEFIQMETGSSVFEESSPYARKRIKKKLQTLDNLLEKHQGFQQIDFLKLDVQGYELEVLKGASSILKRAEFVLLETSFIPINKGCPLILEVMIFMDTMGFRPFDFCSQVRRKDGTLWATDLLFINNHSSWLPDPHLDESNWEISKQARELLQKGSEEAG